jgi:hypothetical protein
METRMDRITTRMMEHICDNLCKYPDQLSEEELEDKCTTDCKIGKYVCAILNHHNKCKEICEECIDCRWQQLNGGTCKGGKARCGQFVKERA